MKREGFKLDTLSEWIKSIGVVLKRRIRLLKHSVNTRPESIFSDPDVVTELSRLHENFVIVPADKASNNYTFVCKRYYVDILIEELGLSSKCSTKLLSILLTKLLTHIKQGLQKYCETAYTRSGVNQMCILKNSKELLEHLQYPISTISQASRPLIFRPFTQPFYTRNLKADSQLSSKTLSFTKMEIADTNFWF